MEEDDKKRVPCSWRGSLGELQGHRDECAWEPVKCLYKGCTESPLRKDQLEHEVTCGIREVSCGHCENKMTSRSLAGHEIDCPLAEIDCPNEGCHAKRTRGRMNLHRAECKHEKVTCPFANCDARVLNKDVIAHLRQQHLGKGVKLEQAELFLSTLRQNDVLRGKVAASESEQRHAAASPTSWAFNWRADGWGGGEFASETHDYGGSVKGWCVFQSSSKLDSSHFIGYGIKGRDKCRVHATLSILDKDDKILRTVYEAGTAEKPDEDDLTVSSTWGYSFTPTAAEKAQSERADGSIRLRAEVRLFLE
jgi:hypothetical protein